MKIKKLTALIASAMLAISAVPMGAGAEYTAAGGGEIFLPDGTVIEFTNKDIYNDYVNSDFSQSAELGDVNHDGFVNAIDATMVMVYYADLSTNDEGLYTEEQHENFYKYGDLDNDGYVDAKDSVLILQIYSENATPLSE